MAVVLALCQGLSPVPLTVWRIRISSVATATSFGAVRAAGLLTKTLGVGTGIAVLLGGLLATSP
jgi:hypothetical protein